MNDEGTIDLIEGALKAVAVAVKDLVAVSETHVQRVGNPDQQKLIGNFTKQLIGGQAHLEQTAVTLSPALVDENCRRQVTDSADFVRGLSEGLTRVSIENLPEDPELNAAFFNASNNVYSAIDTLLNSILVGEDRGASGGDLMHHYGLLTESIPVLTSKTSNQKQLLDGVKSVAMNGNEVLRAVLDMAVTQPPESKKELNRLVAMNKQNLAKFTPKGKDAVRQPNDMVARDGLAASAEEVKNSMDALVQVANIANVDSVLRKVERTVSNFAKVLRLQRLAWVSNWLLPQLFKRLPETPRPSKRFSRKAGLCNKL